MLTRQEVLHAIRAVCKNNSLQYTLEFEYEENNGARMRIAYVKPENLLDYMYLLVAGKRWTSDAEDVVEEEVVLEIRQEGTKWEHKIVQTKELPTGESVIEDIDADISDALSDV